MKYKHWRIYLHHAVPCVEEVDPGLALLDLEQRAAVGEQPRLELLDHLDLQHTERGGNIYRLAREKCGNGCIQTDQSDCQRGVHALPEMHQTCGLARIGCNINVTNRYLFDDHIGQMVKY